MDPTYLLLQTMNGIQYGLLLFLVASGLTLIFGIMGIINLAHGSFYMIGAYLAYWLSGVTGSFWLALLLAVPITVIVGLLIERIGMSFLYERDHLYQVLLTYGLILVLSETRSILWGDDVHSVPKPESLDWSVPLTETLSYPVYNLFVSGVCLALALALYLVIQRTRLGMMVRAGASNRQMVQALGINVTMLFALVFGVGAALAGFAGMIAAPANTVYPGMGAQVLIISFVVVVIGGVGSIKGAFIAALLVGLADTYGRVFLPEVSGTVVYALMALVLLWRPQGLFGKVV